MSKSAFQANSAEKIALPQNSQLTVYLKQYPMVKIVFKPETQQWITKMPVGAYKEVVAPTQRMRIWDINGVAQDFAKQR
jgi:hypothetical protein